MNILVLGGFLGSGKTTILLDLAKTIVGDQPDADKVSLAIIENEIGEVGIDDKLLQDGPYEVSSLFSGCICCSLASDLTIAIDDIAAKYGPEFIIIEATGLAYPDKIHETISTYAKSVEGIKTIVIADAERWDDNYEFLEILLCGQLKCADVVLLNKIDAVTEDQVTDISEQIREINERASIYPISAINGVDKNIWNAVLERGEG